MYKSPSVDDKSSLGFLRCAFLLHKTADLAGSVSLFGGLLHNQTSIGIRAANYYIMSELV